MADATLSIILKAKDEVSATLKAVGGNAGGLESKLTSLAKVAAGAAAGFASFKALEGAISSTQALGESVRKLSMQTGLSAEQSSHYIFMLHETGLAATDAEKAFGIFAKGLIGIVDAETGSISGGKKTADVLAEIGVKAFDATGHIRPLNELIPDVSDHFRVLADGSEKTAIAMQLFGKSGKEMIPFLNLGSVAMKEMSAEADKLGVTLSAQNVEQIHAYTMAQRQMGEAIEGVKVKIGMALLPALTEAANGISHFMMNNHEAIDQLAHLLPGAIETTAGAMKDIANGARAGADALADLTHFASGAKVEIAALGLVVAFLFPGAALLTGLGLIAISFNTLNSDSSKLSKSALDFKIAWLTAIQSILSALGHFYDAAEAPLRKIGDGLGWLADKFGNDGLVRKAADALSGVGTGANSNFGGAVTDIQSQIDAAKATQYGNSIRDSLTGALDAMHTSAGGADELSQSLAGGGGGGGGLTAAEKAAQQGLIDMALAFADFHAATGLGEQDFMAMIQMSQDRADMDKRAASAALDLKVNELEAADGGFQLQKALVGIAEDAAKAGRTIPQELAHLWQGITAGIQSAFSALNGSQTREGAQLQLQIDKAQLEFDNAQRHGASQKELDGLQKHIDALQQQSKIREDNNRIQKDLFDVANQMLPTDQQKLIEETMYIAAQHDATGTLRDVTAIAALQAIAQENYINALGNASGALGGRTAADPYSAAQKHWINGVADSKGEPEPFPGFATGGVVPYTGRWGLTKGEVVTNPALGQSPGGVVQHIHIGTLVLEGGPDAGIASMAGMLNG